MIPTKLLSLKIFSVKFRLNNKILINETIPSQIMTELQNPHLESQPPRSPFARRMSQLDLPQKLQQHVTKGVYIPSARPYYSFARYNSPAHFNWAKLFSPSSSTVKFLNFWILESSHYVSPAKNSNLHDQPTPNFNPILQPSWWYQWVVPFGY